MNNGIIDIKKVKQANASKEKTVRLEKIDDQIRAAKHHGYEEINLYREYVDEFIDKTNKLAMFRDACNEVLEDQFRFILISQVLDAFIRSIFEGEQPPFIDDDQYSRLRVNMYDALIDKYCGPDNDIPF